MGLTRGRAALGSLRPFGFASLRQPDAYGAGESRRGRVLQLAQWIETLKRNHALAEVHGWTPQRPLDGQANFHGSAYAIPWFSFCASIHQLKTTVYDP